MAVSARRPTRRRPYGTIAILALAALLLVKIAIPLSRGQSLQSAMSFSSFLGTPVEAAESEEAGPVAPPRPAEGQLRAYISAREIPAYTKITRDDLWDRNNGRLTYIDVDAALVEQEGILVGVGDIVGRVLGRTKSKGYVFTERDFLPKGTRPGLSAGVPPGKRALRIDVEKVHGIIGLEPGDRFDMVAARPLDATQAAPSAPLSGVYSDRARQMAQQGAYKRARVDVLVQNGTVVTPLQTRLVPTTSTTLTRGQTTRTTPVQEMVIALDPEEVAPFMEALSVEANVVCLARSGRPDDPPDSITPASRPRTASWSPGSSTGFSQGEPGDGTDEPGEMRVVESITDDERTFVPVPRGESRENR